MSDTTKQFLTSFRFDDEIKLGKGVQDIIQGQSEKSIISKIIPYLKSIFKQKVEFEGKLETHQFNKILEEILRFKE